MHDIALIAHFIGLAMGLGTSFAFLFLGIAGAKMDTRTRLQFQLHTMVLSRMGLIGLLLIVGSGLVLMSPYWPVLAQTPLLISKLVLVLVLLLLILRITQLGNKAKKEDSQVHLEKIKPFGKLSLLTALTIVVLAVLIFH